MGRIILQLLQANLRETANATATFPAAQVPLEAREHLRWWWLRMQSWFIAVSAGRLWQLQAWSTHVSRTCTQTPSWTVWGSIHKGVTSAYAGKHPFYRTAGRVSQSTCLKLEFSSLSLEACKDYDLYMLKPGIVGAPNFGGNYIGKDIGP